MLHVCRVAGFVMLSHSPGVGTGASSRRYVCAQVTFLLLSPPPQLLEQGDQSETCHLDVNISFFDMYNSIVNMY